MPGAALPQTCLPTRPQRAPASHLGVARSHAPATSSSASQLKVCWCWGVVSGQERPDDSSLAACCCPLPHQRLPLSIPLLLLLLPLQQPLLAGTHAARHRHSAAHHAAPAGPRTRPAAGRSSTAGWDRTGGGPRGVPGVQSSSSRRAVAGSDDRGHPGVEMHEGRHSTGERGQRHIQPGCRCDHGPVRSRRHGQHRSIRFGHHLGGHPGTAVLFGDSSVGDDAPQVARSPQPAVAGPADTALEACSAAGHAGQVCSQVYGTHAQHERDHADAGGPASWRHRDDHSKRHWRWQFQRVFGFEWHHAHHVRRHPGSNGRLDGGVGPSGAGRRRVCRRRRADHSQGICGISTAGFRPGAGGGRRVCGRYLLTPSRCCCCALCNCVCSWTTP